MDDFELFLMFYLLYLMYQMCLQITQRQRRWWVSPLNLNRDKHGYFVTSFLKQKELDPQQFFKHTRMSRNLYDQLLKLLEVHLKKHSIRKPIDFECRLALTLTYLSQGISQQFLAWSFQMGKSTVRSIILETCKIIWTTLHPIYVSPPTANDYEKIADDFYTRWNMPHCVGAIDGKYITLECPPNSGSLHYDHKGRFSIVLLATCDANYTFTFVDVGAYGSQSDGGILADSLMGKALLNNSLPVPRPRHLPHSEQIVPYYLVGDAAFPLRQNLMRPFPGRQLDEQKRIFNYRLSRARRIIENTFGILVARWRILTTTIKAFPDNADHIVLATIALHNYIQRSSGGCDNYCPGRYVDWEDEHGNLQPGQWRQEAHTLPSARLGSNNASRYAFHIRETLANYFMHEGAVPFQYGRH